MHHYDTYDIYDFDNQGRLRNRSGPDEHGIWPPGAEFQLKADKPYSYEPFYVYFGPDKQIDGSVYSDRLQGWDAEKYREASQEVFETPHPNFKRSSENVEKFMRIYTGKPNLVLCKVIEYCNVSNGYPCWRIDYHVPGEGS